MSGKQPACQCRRHKRWEFNPWVRKIPWRRKWQPTPVFLPGEFPGQRNLLGYSPQGHKKSDTTGATYHALDGLVHPLHFTGKKMYLTLQINVPLEYLLCLNFLWFLAFLQISVLIVFEHTNNFSFREHWCELPANITASNGLPSFYFRNLWVLNHHLQGILWWSSG